MTHRRELLVVVIVLLAFSCAPKRSEISLNTETTPVETLVRAVEQRTARLTSLVGRGIVSFESPEISGTASFQSNMKKPDSLLVKLEGPFGIDVGTFFLSSDRYVMYNSWENSVTTGNPSSSAIRSVIPFELTSDQLLSAFAGVFPIRHADANLQRYAVEEEQFMITYANASHSFVYWIDPRYLVVTRFEQRDTNNGLEIEAKTSAQMMEEDVVVARRIQVEFPKQQRQISIYYESVKLNSPDTDFRFTIPSSARKVDRF